MAVPRSAEPHPRRRRSDCPAFADRANLPYLANRPGRAVTQNLGERAALASSGTAYLLLDVAGTPCALPRAAVAEVLPLPDLHAPPATGGWLTGFLNLGGTPVPSSTSRPCSVSGRPHPRPTSTRISSSSGARRSRIAWTGLPIS